MGLHSVPDLGHGRLPLDCPSRITTGADQRLCLAQKRWVVERTFGWLMGSRRLVRVNYCHKPGDVHLPCHDPLDGEWHKS